MANSTQIPADSSTSGWEPTVQDQINLALATNGGIKRIEAVMQQRLDEAGWTQNLKEYVTKLLRSGEATSYDDCLAKVMAAVNGKEGMNGVNGAGANVQAPDLAMPEDAKQDAAAAVKKEIRPLLVEKKDGADVMPGDEKNAGREPSPTDTLVPSPGLGPTKPDSELLSTLEKGEDTRGPVPSQIAAQPRNPFGPTEQSFLWSHEEDAVLAQLRANPPTQHMTWKKLAVAFNDTMLSRPNYHPRSEYSLNHRWKRLRADPSIVGPWTADEDALLRRVKLNDARMGLALSDRQIAVQFFPRRSGFDIASRWNLIGWGHAERDDVIPSRRDGTHGPR